MALVPNHGFKPVPGFLMDAGVEKYFRKVLCPYGVDIPIRELAVILIPPVNLHTILHNIGSTVLHRLNNIDRPLLHLLSLTEGSEFSGSATAGVAQDIAYLDRSKWLPYLPKCGIRSQVKNDTSKRD